MTPTAVKQVLTGDKAAGGPVLQTTAEDYVFLYYVGMGGEGVVRCGGVYHLDPSEVPDPTYVRLQQCFFIILRVFFSED